MFHYQHNCYPSWLCATVQATSFPLVCGRSDNIKTTSRAIKCCSSGTRWLTKQDKIGYRLDIRLDIRLYLYIDTHSRLPIITTCFMQLPACLLVTIPSSHHSHCKIGLLYLVTTERFDTAPLASVTVNIASRHLF